MIGYDPDILPHTVRMTTGSGVEAAARLFVDKIKALGQERLNFPVVVHTLPPTASVDGVLGLDFLRNDELPFHLEVGVDDADAAYTQVQSLGMTPDGPPEDKPWGERDFYVRDPDGNVVEFSGKRS